MSIKKAHPIWMRLLFIMNTVVLAVSDFLGKPFLTALSLICRKNPLLLQKQL